MRTRAAVVILTVLSSLILSGSPGMAAEPDLCTLPFKPHWCES